jgi:hypothetical protein
MQNTTQNNVHNLGLPETVAPGRLCPLINHRRLSDCSMKSLTSSAQNRNGCSGTSMTSRHFELPPPFPFFTLGHESLNPLSALGAWRHLWTAHYYWQECYFLVYWTTYTFVPPRLWSTQWRKYVHLWSFCRILKYHTEIYVQGIMDCKGVVEFLRYPSPDHISNCRSSECYVILAHRLIPYVPWLASYHIDVEVTQKGT